MPPRRALSCTECKRRKTRCSALGKTPCDACVARRHPEACHWAGAGTQNSSSDAITAGDGESSSVAADPIASLRQELLALRNEVTSVQRNQNLPSASFSADDLAHSRGTRRKRGSDVPSPRDSPETHTLNGLARTPHSSTSSPRQQLVGRELRFFIPEALDPLRRETFLMAQTRLLLPPSPICDRLVDLFFGGSFHVGWHIINEEAFRLGCSRNSPKIHDPNTDVTTIDLDWLSLYLLILAIASRLNPHSTLIVLLPTLNPDDAPRLADALKYASSIALSINSTDPTASFMRLQTLLLSSAYTLHIGDPEGESGFALELLDLAVTAAQSLHLDLEDDWTEPSMDRLKDDPTLQLIQEQNRASCIRQTYRYLFYLDGVSRLNCRHSRLSLASSLFAPAPSDLARNGNIDFAMVGATLADVIRRHDDCQINHTDLIQKSAAVWAYDGELVNLLRVFPAFQDSLQSPTVSKDGLWMALILYGHIQNRRLRAHRSFFPAEPGMSMHIGACMNAAVSIIDSRRTMIRLNNLLPRFADRWVFNAVLVLAMARVCGLNGHPEVAPPVSHADNIRRALEIFQDRASDKSQGPDPRQLTIQSILATVRSIRAHTPTNMSAGQRGSADVVSGSLTESWSASEGVARGVPLAGEGIHPSVADTDDILSSSIDIDLEPFVAALGTDDFGSDTLRLLGSTVGAVEAPILDPFSADNWYLNF